MRSKVLLLAVLIALVLSLTIGTVSASADGCRKHYVNWGETLYSIGRKYNVNPYAIAHANYIRHPDYIQGGTWVCVPYGPPYPGYVRYDKGYNYGHGYDRYDKGHGYGYYDKGYDYGRYDKGYDYGRYDKGYDYSRYDKGHDYGRYDMGHGHGYGY